MALFNLAQSAVPVVRARAPVCIVGGGFAGLLVAHRLVQLGQNVIVLESGGETTAEWTDKLSEIDDPSGRYVRSVTGRSRGLGGTSVKWSGRMLPITRHDAGPRPYLDLPGWPFHLEELEAYRTEIETLFSVGHETYEEELLDMVGLTRDFLRRDADFAPRWPKWPSFHNCNIANVLGREIRYSTKIEVWLGATVCAYELDRESGRIESIQAGDLGGRRLRVQADHVVFAAGTIETTRLLLLLDRHSGGRAFEGCDALGCYFQDHLDADVGMIRPINSAAQQRLFSHRFVGSTRRSLHLELTPAAQKADCVGSAFASVQMNFAGSAEMEILKRFLRGLQRNAFDINLKEALRLAQHSNLLAQLAFGKLARKQIYVPASVDRRIHVCVEQLPSKENKITLSDQIDAFGMSKVRLAWSPTEREEKTFQSVVRRLAHYWVRSGFDLTCPIEWADRDRGRRIVDRAEDFAHPSGSTRMGLDKRHSVVGPDLYCWHVRDVSVVSASTFPTAGSANPTLTLMLLALRAADSISSRVMQTNDRPNG
ncbi:MAG: hypothetical protein JWM36_3400 [Hyphomicrobiales bacterium]|nr:hypothetical protein [Hyphomicrobiales bacterium]